MADSTLNNNLGYPRAGETGVRTSLIPTGLAKKMSTTSLANECFVNQRFSGKLQAFLIGYNNSIYSEHSVYL
jgi:hypothetical protein